MKTTQGSVRGSTLLLSLACLTTLAIAAAYTLQRITPRFQMAAQAAAWQEARLSAEAGIDIALVELEKNALGFNEGKWTSWLAYDQGGPPPTLSRFPTGANTNLPVSAGSGKPKKSGLLGGVVSGLTGTIGSLLGIKSPSGNATGHLKKAGNVVPATAEMLGLSNSLLALLGNPVEVSQPIFLDDLQMASVGNRPTNVDVQLWALYPTPNPYSRWFRLRSLATVALPPLATRTHDRMEGEFRRYSLRQMREQLTNDDMGMAMTVPTPNTSRIIEALVEPLLPFQLAILTDESLKLGTSGSWLVDSYDSSDPGKSAPGGQYPGASSPLAQAEGNIGTNAARPPEALYGPLIAANGTRVRGAVATNGGDDPSTGAHESLSGAGKIDPARVRDDFYRELRPLARPNRGIFLRPPTAGSPFIAGTPSQPNYYLVTSDLGAFKVSRSPLGGAGAVVIMVNGNLTVPDGAIHIAPNVQAQLFVAGNVDFHDRPINAGGLPAQLQIYGEDSRGDRRTLHAFGNASITAAFYGPHYDVRLSDNVEWFGAVAARSFEMLGGGTGGFHYDEALGLVGAPIGFRIARYVEDVRQ